jgi:hypothetical protein
LSFLLILIFTITITEKLIEDSKRLEQKIGWFGMGIKPATQRMDEAMTSNLPIMLDDLGIYRSAVTSSLLVVSHL